MGPAERFGFTFIPGRVEVSLEQAVLTGNVTMKCAMDILKYADRVQLGCGVFVMALGSALGCVLRSGNFSRHAQYVGRDGSSMAGFNATVLRRDDASKQDTWRGAAEACAVVAVASYVFTMWNSHRLRLILDKI